ncbi:hypothetical protein WDW86_09885 [Bdellovibrionota bacterium FG-2]
MNWEKDGTIFIKASHTVRGDERVDACFDLVKLDGKEALVSEIQNQMKGQLDHHIGSINESAETVLGKSRSSEFTGKISGMKFTEQYFERYRIGPTERIDCHSLAEVKQADYDAIKRSILEKVESADPRIKEAIAQKQINFFKHEADSK